MPLVVEFGGQPLASAVAGPDVLVTVGGVRGRSVIAPEVSLDRSVALDGSRFVDLSFPPREITIEVAVVSDSLLTQRAAERALMGWLTALGPRRLEFSDQPGRYYEAVFSMATHSRGQQDWSGFSLVFTCPRPYLFGGSVSGEVALAEPLDLQTNWYVEPKWSVRASGAVPGFTLEVGGREYVYDGPVAANQTVVIDAARRETRVGGALRVPEVSGVYPIARYGDEVTLSVAGSVEFEYEARWL